MTMLLYKLVKKQLPIVSLRNKHSLQKTKEHKINHCQIHAV